MNSHWMRKIPRGQGCCFAFCFWLLGKENCIEFGKKWCKWYAFTWLLKGLVSTLATGDVIPRQVPRRSRGPRIQLPISLPGVSQRHLPGPRGQTHLMSVSPAAGSGLRTDCGLTTQGKLLAVLDLPSPRKVEQVKELHLETEDSDATHY